MNKNFVEIEIYGTTIKINVSKDIGKDYLYRLATMIEEKMVEVGNFIPEADPLKVAIITLLNIADENFQLKNKLYQYEKTIEDVEKKLHLLNNIFIKDETGINPF